MPKIAPCAGRGLIHSPQAYGLIPHPGTGIGEVPVVRLVARAKSELCSGHLSGRSNGQLQRPAQSSEIGVTRTAVVRFPKIDARCADADLFGNVSNRQATSNASFTKMASERRFAGQG